MKKRRMRRYSSSSSGSMMGNMVKMGVGNLVGVGLITPTAQMVQGLPAGSMERNIAGIVPGLQATALVGANLGAMGMGGRRKKKRSY